MYHLLSAFVTVSVIVFKAQAHLWMGTPVPFGNETLNNSPLDNTGVDYPCKLRPAAFHVTQMNYAKAGEKVHVSFLGVSVHGMSPTIFCSDYSANRYIRRRILSMVNYD